VIHHRHTRGIVLDLNSEVCPQSFLDNAKVGKDVDVYQSILTDSWADHSKIVKSTIQEGDIRESELVLSTVVWSDVIDSKVYDSKIINSNIHGATVRGGVILGCTIDADCVVGDAVLEGLTITEPVRIGHGYWTRVPRSFVINNEITTGVVVSESNDGFAYIGCQRKPMKQWIKGAARYGKAIGWDTVTVDLIASKFKEWLEDN
jgi:hypothetical protein